MAKHWKERIPVFMAGLLGLIAVLLAGYIQLYGWLHPDMTDKRVFIETMPHCIAAAVAGIASLLCVRWEWRR